MNWTLCLLAKNFQHEYQRDLCICFYIIFVKTHNALRYVYLSIENNSSNALNDIDVICKSFLLSSSKLLLIISHKWTLFEGVKIFIGNGSKRKKFFPSDPWKFKSINGLIFFPTSIFVMMCLNFTEIGC